MKSAVLPSFWESYRALNSEVRQSARKAYRLWAENPFHPSLRFNIRGKDSPTTSEGLVEGGIATSSLICYN